MGASTSTPKGNVYSANEFNSEPIFPVYAEHIHSTWLGFKNPNEVPEKPLFLSLENADVMPDVGVEYILHTYRDEARTQEITLDEALQEYDYGFKVDGGDIEYLYTVSGRVKGVRVTKIYPCSYVRNLRFALKRSIKWLKYYEMKSVTETMNNAIDNFIQDLDRLNTVKSNFANLVDIRKLEDINVT